MSRYAPGRYRLHDLATVELRTTEAADAYFLAGLPGEAAPGPADLVWDDAPAGGLPLATDARARVPPRSFAAVDAGGRWHLAGPDHDGRLPTQDVLLRRGASLVHGAALEVEGRGVLVLGPPGAGKTALSLAPLADPAWRLIADDVVVATAGGRLLATEAPLAVYPEHVPLLPDAALREVRLRPSVKRGWRALRSAPVVGAAARAAKRVAAGRPGALGRWARGFEARYWPVPPGRLFAADRRSGGVPVAVVLVLEPRRPAWDVAPVGEDAVASLLVGEAYADGDLHAELGRYGRVGVVDVPRHWRDATSVLGALAAAAATRVGLGIPARAAPTELQRRGMAAVRAALP